MHYQACPQRIVQTAITITPSQNHLRTVKLKTQPNRRITRKRPRVQQLLPQRTRLHQRPRRSQAVLMRPNNYRPYTLISTTLFYC
jgi:hypothetical protein